MNRTQTRSPPVLREGAAHVHFAECSERTFPRHPMVLRCGYPAHHHYGNQRRPASRRLHPTSPRRRLLTVHAARPCPRSWWTLSFNASTSSSGGDGLRSALVASSSSVSSGRRRPEPDPRIVRATSNFSDARRSKGVPTSVTSKRAVRLLRASPRSAWRITSRSRSRCCSVPASGVPPLAQECMRCGDTPKSCPSSAQVNPPMRRNSEIARRVVSSGSVVPNRVTT